jgi:putative ABC transport system substrate-binding protein
VLVTSLIPMRWRPWIMGLLLVSVAVVVGIAGAADRDRPIRIGALNPSWGPTPLSVGLRDGLVQLGYREDEDFVVGIRFTQGDLTELPTAARQLVQYGVDLIFAAGDHSAQVAQNATTRIPIVFAPVSDPVGLGLVESFARPGGNITGVADLARMLGAKRLQIFLEFLPSLKRVLFLYDAGDALAEASAGVYREAAQQLGIELVQKGVRTAEEARAVLDTMHASSIDGILAPRCCSLNIPGSILDMATPQGIPAMFENAFWVDHGGLVSYGADYYASGKQAARLVHKILKGAKPGELPVEVNPKIEFAINLKTVKALGLTVAPEVLYRADRLVR